MARVRGVVLFGSLVAFACAGPLAGCGDPDDLSSAGAIAPDSVAATTLQSESSTLPPTSVEVVPVDTFPATTTTVNDIMTSPPTTMVATPEASDASVQALGAVLGVEGELEQREGEHGIGQCIGRLEPRGLCVNVPLWGVWQYWDLAAQESPGASDDQARNVAVDLFARLGVDPGEVISIEPNGPLPQVKFSSGTLVMVAEDDRIASVITGPSLLPPG